MTERLITRLREQVGPTDSESNEASGYGVYRHTRNVYRRASRAMGRKTRYSESVNSTREVEIQNDAGGSTKVLDSRGLA